MKQFFRWGVLATALMVLSGGAAQAQQPMPATKVGLVNMGLLFTKYNKAAFLKTELEKELAPLKAEAEKIKSIVKQHVEYIQNYPKAEQSQLDISRKAIKDGERALLAAGG